MNRNPEDIYRNDATSERLIVPFHMEIQPMEQLLLVNLGKDPDREYMGFEPQVFDDDVQGAGMLVIAYRNDGYVDVYHERHLNLEKMDYSIVGEGLGELLPTDFDRARFEISAHGVDVHIEFQDKFDRRVGLLIKEEGQRNTKPFSLLAPLGTNTTTPPALPLFLLFDFYFVRRAGTEVEITIDERAHKPDRLGFPIDGRRVYFMRYSADPLIAQWNPTHEGSLPWWTPNADMQVEGQGATFDVIENEGRLEIAAMKTVAGSHEVVIEFSPPIPDLASLRDGATTDGEFRISTDPSMGIISGDYQVQRQADTVKVTIHPSGGWQPQPDRFSLKLVYALGRFFRNWPKTYEWQATLTFGEDAEVAVDARWRRIDR